MGRGCILVCASRIQTWTEAGQYTCTEISGSKQSLPTRLSRDTSAALLALWYITIISNTTMAVERPDS
jgi:hypothetical protein